MQQPRSRKPSASERTPNPTQGQAHSPSSDQRPHHTEATSFTGTMTIRSEKESLDFASSHRTSPFAYWTDGSQRCKGDETFCAAGVHFQHEAGHSYKGYALVDGKENNDAEMFAVGAGLKAAALQIGQMDAAGRPQRILLFSDSQSALAELCRWPDSMPGLVRDVAGNAVRWAQKLRTMGVAVDMHWVKGHGTSAGNKLADQVAATVTRWVSIMGLQHGEGVPYNIGEFQIVNVRLAWLGDESG
ncbi:hypothetical protein BDW42DRAFT_159701 [Aspergillus taichungensis]|uniref:RNase H type-1 domain-containing protein n=1 Tax=Aspergillus taichungensis TaxID=482145 RepID=A0A2J5I7G0_9EURO|nr:hypothetical protein BDW42DRAFT_159701 [Aspergillus taichungensis]